MTNRVEFKFSRTFDGSIWSTLAVSDTSLLVIEIRNEETHEVKFSAFDYIGNKFLWENISFSESWWIGLAAATPDVLLLQVFLETDNPDDKGLIAWHLYDQKLLWTVNHFTFQGLDEKFVYGKLANEDGWQDCSIDVLSGKIVDNITLPNTFKENIMIQKPFQYLEGNAHFETVKTFLTSRQKITPVSGVEYLEDQHLLYISYLVQEGSLANYLVVYTHEGELILHEKIGEHVKGLGLDTFFILSGCLFFVRNKSELICYRLV